MRFLLLSVVLAACTTSRALHESDVGVSDWHKHLVGVPLTHSLATAPVFHVAGNTSLVLTATGSNVLAALDPSSGDVAWRYIFEREDQIAGFYTNGNVVAALSGPGGSILRNFEADTGLLIHEKRLHSWEQGSLAPPNDMGTQVVFVPGTPDMYTLTNGHTVHCMDGNTGDLRWVHTFSDRSSLIIHSKLVYTAEALYAVGIAKSIASFTLHVTSFVPSTGTVIQSRNLPSDIKDPLSQLATITHGDSPLGCIVWLENGNLLSVALTPRLDAKPAKFSNDVFNQIVDIGVSEHGLIVGINDGKGHVLKLSDDRTRIQKIWDFADSGNSERAIYSGGIDKDGHPYIARTYWTHSLKKGAIDVFAAHLGQRGGVVGSHLFPFDAITHGVMTHVALNPLNPAGGAIKSRILVTTSTGSIQMWSQETPEWIREEGLSTLRLAEFVELPERLAVVSSQAGVGQEGFISRLLRHVHDTKDFPRYISNFVKRFVTGSYPSIPPVSFSESSTSESLLFRDAFGFRQIVVAATMSGKVYGIDSSNGDILWSKILGIGWTIVDGGTIVPVKLFVTKNVSEGGFPEVVLVTQRRAENTLVDTVVYHINALTGEDVKGKSKDGVLEGTDIIAGPAVATFMLPTEPKTIILFDEFLQVYLFPDTAETRAAFAAIAPTLSFPLRTNIAGISRIVGHQLVLDDSLSDRFVGFPDWTLTLPPNEAHVALIEQTRNGPVASLGKVLGNRTTAYKYLNPRLFVLLTASPRSSTCGIYLVDGVKGTVVYKTLLPANAGTCDIKAVFVENLLVYHYYHADEKNEDGARGWKVVSVEFYEGSGADDKTQSSDMSAFNNATLSYTTYEEAFIFPHAISAIAVTATKFGITSKDIIVATKNNRIQSFPRHLLDPRRPHRKVTAEEAEEQLTQYEPVLLDDSRCVLSHNLQVANTMKIITAPSLLESTSLVLAFGLDMFLTRVSPSGTFDILSESFNKAQLVLTVSGLALAILVTKPMVARKKLKEKWYMQQ